MSLRNLSKQTLDIAQELTSLGTPLFFNGPVGVQEQKINKPPTEFFGSFIGNPQATPDDFPKGAVDAIIEIRVYSASYYVIKTYRKGKPVKTEQRKTQEEAKEEILLALNS
jgi:hypothetical protein